MSIKYTTLNKWIRDVGLSVKWVEEFIYPKRFPIFLFIESSNVDFVSKKKKKKNSTERLESVRR